MSGNNITTFRMICKLLTPFQQRSAFWLLSLMMIGMLLEMLGLGLLIPAIIFLMKNDLTLNYPSTKPILEALGNPSQMELVIGSILLLVGVYLVKALFLAFLAWRQAKFTFVGVQAHLSKRLFRTYLFQSYTFHMQRNSAQLIRNATTEVNMFTTAITQSLNIAAETLVIIGISLMLVVIEPVGSVIVLLVFVCVAWGFHRSTSSFATRWGFRRQHHDGQLIQHLQQGLGGIKEVKLYGREQDFLSKYHDNMSQVANACRFMNALQQMPRLCLEMLAVTGLAVLVLVMLKQGQDMESIVPVVGLFSASAFRLMPSANRIVSAIQSLRFNVPAVKTLYEELQNASSSRMQNAKKKLLLQHDINLSKINFTYPNAQQPAVKEVSLQIIKGETIGLVGASGSGKSTLVNIILGLITPSSGHVLIDSQDIQPCLRAWQNKIGYVPQFIFLTDDTMKRNIAFGIADEQISDTAVQRAIKAAQLMPFVNSLPEGLNTKVGERGVRLSGGQLQRIGIARAFYHDPQVIVLDEATSSLDYKTEQEVMKAIEAFRGRKTTLIISHRMRTLRCCDRIYHMKQGAIVKQEDMVKEGAFEDVS